MIVMAKINELNRFQIIGLYGFRNIDIDIKDNIIIFVGENGLGKTTILKYLFAVLSGGYFQLPVHKFKKIIVTINNKIHELTYDDLHPKYKIDSDIFRFMPAPVRRNLELRKNNLFITKQDIIDSCEKTGYPAERVFQKFHYISETDSVDLFENGRKIALQISAALKARVIYLPTYRRIEEDLPHVVRGKYALNKEINDKKYLYGEYDDNEMNSYIELVEFGMQDVKDKIDKICSELSRFSESSFKNLAYMNLGDVIDKKYISSNAANVTISKNDIEKFKLCLSRNNKEMLSKKQVEELIQAIGTTDNVQDDTHNQILLYYFKNLLSLQSDLEKKEKNINNFCNICNKYLSSSDKKITYDMSTFKVQILKENNYNNDSIDMSDLSSGEKQIVSLFSHLFLTENKKSFVIIDEPELSLSVPWQKRFLNDIKNSSLCVGLIAATHSPFIYDNELLQYTHSLGEYIEEAK